LVPPLALTTNPKGTAIVIQQDKNHLEHNGTRGGLILLAEDDENDIELFRRAFSQAQIRNPLQIVRDGDEAIAYLNGERKFSDRARYPLPALMLLDLNMPRKDGFEVLEWIRSQPELKILRVVVLTISRNVYDVTRAYRLGANSFFVKSLDAQTFSQLVESIHAYWLSAGLTPRIGPAGGPIIGSDRTSPSP
jgi:CheY-like chemotaxis protein